MLRVPPADAKLRPPSHSPSPWSPPPMSSNSSATLPATGPSAPAAPAAPATRDPIATFYQRADALYRCAIESCRQHERLAALVGNGSLLTEQRAAQDMVQVCDEAMLDLAAAYEKCACRAHPPHDDACWHAANGLWLASREFMRRRRTTVRAAEEMSVTGEHSTQCLAELALDYDLEASALLLLKQATEAYRKARPQVG